jgi:hypothetical protein
MSVLLFTEGDELSLQALSLAQTLGDVRAISLDGAYAPAAWAAAIAAASDGADASSRPAPIVGTSSLPTSQRFLDQPSRPT